MLQAEFGHAKKWKIITVIEKHLIEIMNFLSRILRTPIFQWFTLFLMASPLFVQVRTGRLFGGLINDIRRKAPFYLSDYRDGLSVQCIASFFFLYFACLTPIVTFGGLLSDATGKCM